MVARELAGRQMRAAIAADLTVTVKEFAIRKRWNLMQRALAERLAAYGDDAVCRDDGTQPGITAHTALDHELVVASGPGDLIPRIVDHRMLPADPAEGLAMHIKREDQRPSRIARDRAAFNEDHGDSLSTIV